MTSVDQTATVLSWLRGMRHRDDNDPMVTDAVSVTCLTLGPHLMKETMTNLTLHEERL